MRKTTVAVTILVLALIVIAVQYRQEGNREVTKLRCPAVGELGLYDANAASQRLLEDAKILEDRIDSRLSLKKRLELAEVVACDKALGITTRALALSLLFETQATIVALDHGDSAENNWVNMVTGTVGTVLIVESTKTATRSCHVIVTPSTVPGYDDIVTSAIERYCRSGKDWYADALLGTLTFRYRDGMFEPEYK